jgi:hypothetical protein
MRAEVGGEFLEAFLFAEGEGDFACRGAGGPVRSFEFLDWIAHELEDDRAVMGLTERRAGGVGRQSSGHAVICIRQGAVVPTRLVKAGE